MSLIQRQSEAENPARKPKPVAAQNWVTKGLTNPQKAQLSIAAREAFDVQSKHGLTGDQSYDAWRHAETKVACGKESFRDCTNKDFRSVLARFYALAGREKDAAALWQKTGRVKGSDELNDTHENRELCKALIRDKIAASNGAINESYVVAIVRNKHQGKTIHDLTASELQQLVYTITARLNKKE
jgi:hypothetical protein